MSKENLHFDDQSKQVFFLVTEYPKRNRKLFYEFLSSYKNTSQSLREPEKAVENIRLSACVPVATRVTIVKLEHGTYFLFLTCWQRGGGPRRCSRSLFS